MGFKALECNAEQKEEEKPAIVNNRSPAKRGFLLSNYVAPVASTVILLASLSGISKLVTEKRPKTGSIWS
jgi:hypothetical protein